jgi:hypothetical protein
MITIKTKTDLTCLYCLLQHQTSGCHHFEEHLGNEKFVRDFVRCYFIVLESVKNSNVQKPFIKKQKKLLETESITQFLIMTYLITDRECIARDVLEILDLATDPWGIKVIKISSLYHCISLREKTTFP